MVAHRWGAAASRTALRRKPNKRERAELLKWQPLRRGALRRKQVPQREMLPLRSSIGRISLARIGLAVSSCRSTSVRIDCRRALALARVGLAVRPCGAGPAAASGNSTVGTCRGAASLLAVIRLPMRPGGADVPRTAGGEPVRTMCDAPTAARLVGAAMGTGERPVVRTRGTAKTTAAPAAEGMRP